MALFEGFDVRIDPWDIDYGPELSIDTAVEEAEEDVDVSVEMASDQWSPVEPTATTQPERLLFVDGVRRMEARLVVRRGDRVCHGAFGSFAVGCVELTKGEASWGVERVHRLVALGSGERLPSAIPVAPALVYEPVSDADSDPEAPLRAIQEKMRVAEEHLARELADAEGAVVIADGPLTFSEPLRGGALGYVKRLFKIYLGRPHLDVVSKMNVGSRTPLFALRAKRRFARYAWFLRLAKPVGADSPYAGIARLEVSEDVGADGARRLADATASVLPRLAPGRGRDPRAPQNLFPIGALESRLRRSLGDARLARRRIESLVVKEMKNE